MNIYVCPNVQNNMDKFFYSMNNPNIHCEEVNPARKRLVVYGQKGIGKEDQLDTVFREKKVSTCKLLVTSDMEETLGRLKDITLNCDDVLVIRNAHLLPRMCSNTTIRGFAMNLALLDNYIIAISDEPYQSSPFMDQFQIKVNMTLPPQSYLKTLYMYYFETFATHCIENKLDIVVSLSDADYTWLSQSSDSCTPGDIREFCANVCNYATDAMILTKKKVVIDTILLKNTDNKLMFDITGCGILSITSKETHKRQQMFDTMSGVGCVPQIKRAKKN